MGIDLRKDCTINSHHVHPVASYVDCLGRALTCPTSDFFLVQMAKVVRHIRVGRRQDQASTYSKEIVLRCLRVVLCMLLLLPILALGIVGGLLRTLATLDRRKFVLTQPNFVHPPQKIQTLTLCTFNASMMPSFINLVFRNYSPAKERVEAAALGANESGADVICVQEAFNTEVVDAFAARIAEKYPYIIYNAGFHSLGLGSGLLIASKYPIANPRFWEHSKKLGSEHLGSKGTMAVTILPHPDQPIAIFNTHLEAGVDCHLDPAEIRETRVNQLEQLRRNVNEYPVTGYLCGDMNISSLFDQSTVDFRKLEEVIDVDRSEEHNKGTLYHYLPKQHVRSPCTCLNGVYNGAIDHIGPLKPLNPPLLESRRSCFHGSSDHLAWIAKYDLSHV